MFVSGQRICEKSAADGRPARMIRGGRGREREKWGTKIARVHLHTTIGTPDLSGSRLRRPKPCRINPAFHVVWCPAVMVVSGYVQTARQADSVRNMVATAAFGAPCSTEEIRA